MGVQIIKPEQSKTSAFLEDEEMQQKGSWSNRETPFGKIDARDKEDFLAQVETLFSNQLRLLQEWRATYYDQMWDMCDKAYYGWKSPIAVRAANKDFRSNIRIRYAYKQVESQVSKIVPSITSFDPPISVYPNDENSDQRDLKARAAQKQLKYYFFQKQNANELVLDWIRQGERLGLSPMKMFWSYEERDTNIVRRPILDKEGVLVGLQKIENDDPRIVSDNPENAVVSTRKLWWNTDCVNRKTLRFTFEEYIKPLSYIKNSPLYIKSQTKDLRADSFTDLNNVEDTTRTKGQTKNVDNGEDTIRVTERWDGETLIVEAGGKIIRYRDNPFDDGIIPYYFYRATALNDQLPGMGTIEPMLDLEELANVIVNQRLDNVHRIINRMLLVSSSAGFHKKRLKFTPMGVHTCMNPEKVMPFPMEDVTSSAYIEQQQAENKMDAITGDPDFTKGESSGKESATMTQVRQMGASNRAELKVLAAQYTMGIMFRDMYRLEKQFGDPRKWVKILGPDGIEFEYSHSELFVDDYEFDYTLGGYLGNRLADFQQFIQGLGIIKDIPGMMQQFDLEELAKIFAERSNIRGIEKVLKRPGMVEPGYSRDPYDENRRFVTTDYEIEVMPGEQHTKHIPVHMRMLDVGMLPPETRARLKRHYDMHVFMLMEDNRAQGSIGGQMAQMDGMLGQIYGGTNTDAMPGGTQQEQAYNQAAGPAGATAGGANVRFQ